MITLLLCIAGKIAEVAVTIGATATLCAEINQSREVKNHLAIDINRLRCTIRILVLYVLVLNVLFKRIFQ